jgi:hypothetical protein
VSTEPDSSSSSEDDDDSSSSSEDDDDSSSSSEDCSSGLPVELNLLFDSDPELPDLWYAEDEQNGFWVVSLEDMTFKYGIYNSDGFPLDAQLIINGEPLAIITFPPSYLNTFFSVKHRGIIYCGFLSTNTISFGE